MQEHGWIDIGKEKGITNSFYIKNKKNGFTIGLLLFALTEFENENVTFEKKCIIEQKKDVAEKVTEKDIENKRFIAGMGSFATIVTSGSVVVLASVLGGNTQIETNDIDKIV